MIVSSNEKIKILYVDDEANNLVGFRATFRHDYNVLTANSADEGIALLDKHPDTKIIFCDQRMPGKTGVQFFEEVSALYPNPIRMLLTGYVDIESVIKAINQGHIYRFLTKPWQEADVRSAIEEGYKYYIASSLLFAKNQELQKANEELDKFAYSVTHDIRGPIVSMTGALELMKNTDDITEIRQIISLMEESADKVTDLIENIHAYYSLKRGDINIEEIDFKTLLGEIVAIHRINAKLQKVAINTTVKQEETFRNDKVILQLIINNLLSNALKYQRIKAVDKFVSISVIVEKGQVIMEMEDNGIGIEERYFEDIFKMFFRATKESTGAGFGLYNVKDALNKLQGTITVASTVGAGTKFTVSIPTK